MSYRVVLPVLILGAAALASAQAQPQDPSLTATAAATEAPVKIATIFAQNAIVSTQEGQKAAAGLTAKFEPQRRDFEKKQGELQTLRDQLKRALPTASQEARDRLSRIIEARSTELKRLSEDIQTQMEEQEANLMQDLGNKLLKVIDTYAPQNGYAVVLDVSGRPSPILWAHPSIDITNEVVRLYDKAHPVPPELPAPPPPAKKQ